MKKARPQKQMATRGVSRVLRNIITEQGRSARWQIKHGKEDKKHFGEINDALAAQPTKTEVLNIALNLAESTKKSLEETAIALGKKNEEIASALAEKTQKEGAKVLEVMATKADVAEVLAAWRSIKVGAVVVSNGGKWAFRTLLALGAIGAAIIAIKTGIWAGLAAVGNAIFSK